MLLLKRQTVLASFYYLFILSSNLSQKFIYTAYNIRNSKRKVYLCLKEALTTHLIGDFLLNPSPLLRALVFISQLNFGCHSKSDQWPSTQASPHPLPPLEDSRLSE